MVCISEGVETFLGSNSKSCSPDLVFSLDLVMGHILSPLFLASSS